MSKGSKHSKGFWSYLLWLLLMSIALVSTARGEDRALLIGVGRYAHFDDRLNGVSQDLDMMREMAQLMGFEQKAIKVLEHEQATTAGVYRAFADWLINGTGEQDRVLIYFSGHGSQVPDENHDEKDNFDEVLLLYDTSLSAKNGRQTLDGVLHDDRFHQVLAQIKSRNILVILDACHSGSATRSLRLTPHPVRPAEAQVKYFYYSPMLESAGGSGSFDLMEPRTPADVHGRYVAISACREDEKTVATSRGSVFTRGLHQTLRAAARTGVSLTPEELQRRTTRYIRRQFRSGGDAFHPQIAGHKALRNQPLKLVAFSGGSRINRPHPAALAEKSGPAVRIDLNKTCFEPGDVLEVSLRLTEAGYLNVISETADNRSTVLFPNRYHPQNAVGPGSLTIPGPQMEFEMVSEGPTGPALITAFLSRSPLNSYKEGFKTNADVMARLSPGSARSLVLRQQNGQMAVGRVTVEIRGEGQCE